MTPTQASSVGAALAAERLGLAREVGATVNGTAGGCSDDGRSPGTDDADDDIAMADLTAESASSGAASGSSSRRAHSASTAYAATERTTMPSLPHQPPVSALWLQPWHSRSSRRTPLTAGAPCGPAHSAATAALAAAGFAAGMALRQARAVAGPAILSAVFGLAGAAGYTGPADLRHAAWQRFIDGCGVPQLQLFHYLVWPVAHQAHPDGADLRPLALLNAMREVAAANARTARSRDRLDLMVTTATASALAASVQREYQRGAEAAVPWLGAPTGCGIQLLPPISSAVVRCAQRQCPSRRSGLSSRRSPSSAHHYYHCPLLLQVLEVWASLSPRRTRRLLAPCRRNR